MREADDPDRPLAALALLYAEGELDGPEAAAFEQRLASDQAAREALGEAVRLSRMLAGLAPPVPGPAYREAVRRRLGQRPGLWGRLTQCRSYRGHPMLWALLGAAAAVLVMFALPPHPAPAEGHPAPAPLAGAVDTPAPPPPPAGVTTPEMARVWAELHNSDHLARARADENRRRLRAEERRLARGDRPSRLSGPPSVKH